MPAPTACVICNWHGESDVCPRCGTVLRVSGAKCESCGGELVGPIGKCAVCGSMPAEGDAPADAVRRLAQLPGIDDWTARWLAGHGYEDPADIVKVGLSDRAVSLGVHQTVARKATIDGLQSLRMRVEFPCGVCDTPKESETAVCPACGARGAPEPTPEEIQSQLAQVVGEVHDLEADPDFLGMPSDLRHEILDAFHNEAPGRTHQVESPTFARQFEEWRSRGIDTLPLERVFVEEGEAAFRGKFAPILRRQFAKHREGGKFWCTICKLELDSDEDECRNCGAKFK